MKIFECLFKKRPNKTIISRIVIDPMDMNKWQKTDVIINMRNFPFITLTESKMANVWYHDELDVLFCLTARGFEKLKIGSKKSLAQNGFLR